MPTLKRTKTAYRGVFYIQGLSSATGKPERIYYIRYRKDGKLVEEKAGRQYQDDMTPAKASGIRARRVHGDQPSNTEKRLAEEVRKQEEENKWTIERLWTEYKATNPLVRGIATDENRFLKYLKPNFETKEPKDLSPLDLDRLRIKLLKKKKPGTVKNVFELLRRLINFGVRKGLHDPLPFTIQMPKVHNIKTEDLSHDQLSNLLDTIEEDTHIHAGNMMKMVLFTGMRRGELFKLKWDHIDFERGFISIIDPKGGADQTIPLNDKARELLNSHPRTDSPFVFPGRNGEQRTDINKQLDRIRRKAGLPNDFRPLHGLRHTYASMLASSGKVDLYTLQKLLTHKSPMMTQRYAHLRDEALKRASDLAGEMIGEIVSVREQEQQREKKGRAKTKHFPRNSLAERA